MLGHRAHLQSCAAGPLWLTVSVTLRFSSSSWMRVDDDPGVSIYRHQSLSDIIPKTSVFLNWQRALSQLLSFIRSFAGQTAFRPQLILQTTLCDGYLWNGYFCLASTFPPAVLLFPPCIYSPRDAAFTAGICPDTFLRTRGQGRPHNSWCSVRKCLGPSWILLGRRSDFPLSGNSSSLPASTLCGFLYLAIGLDHMNSCNCFVASFKTFC